MRTTARPLAGSRETTEADAGVSEAPRAGPRAGESPRSIVLSRRRTSGRRLSDWLEASGLKRAVPWAAAAAALVWALAALG